MTTIATFVFNAFQENTYVLYDDSNACIIIDPGCYSDEEKEELVSFISDKKLTPVRLINTHCHLDHILGNTIVAKKYQLKLEIHKEEEPILRAAPLYGDTFGFRPDIQPEPGKYIQHGDVISFGKSKLTVIHTPGHSPGGICLYSAIDNFIIAGDALFQYSIGRTDLPGGDYSTLINSIKTRLLVLPEDTTVYPGHGPETSIGIEKRMNPFLQ